MRDFFPRFWCADDRCMLYWQCYMQTAFNLHDIKLIYTLLTDAATTMLRSTGILDKNNKIIYEEDIMAVSAGIFIIKWCEKCKSFQPHFAGTCYSCIGDYNWFDFIEEPELNILGNTFENAEILKEYE